MKIQLLSYLKIINNINTETKQYGHYWHPG